MAPIDRVIVLLGPRGTSGGDKWIVRVAKEFSERSDAPPFKAYTAQERRFTEVGEQSRKVPLLRPQDAGEVYRAVHDSAVLVIVKSGVRLLMDPRRDPATARTVVNPVTALGHKSHVFVAGTEDEIRSRWGRLETAYPGTVNALRDPRLLPMHMFAPDFKGDLHEERARGRFLNEYRTRGAWQAANAEWQDAEPGARHGRDRGASRCIVCGFEVPSGHHWDVQFSRRDGEVVGLDAVWKVHAGGHANVHPTGYVGGGKKSLKVWSPDTR